MDNQSKIAELEKTVAELKSKLETVTGEVYNKNFSSQKDYTKYSNFLTGLKVPSYPILPQQCEQGEIIESGGVLKICSANNTWTSVGTQS
jgi:hypothetical protein